MAETPPPGSISAEGAESPAADGLSSFEQQPFPVHPTHVPAEGAESPGADGLSSFEQQPIPVYTTHERGRLVPSDPFDSGIASGYRFERDCVNPTNDNPGNEEAAITATLPSIRDTLPDQEFGFVPASPLTSDPSPSAHNARAFTRAAPFHSLRPELGQGPLGFGPSGVSISTLNSTHRLPVSTPQDDILEPYLTGAKRLPILILMSICTRFDFPEELRDECITGRRLLPRRYLTPAIREELHARLREHEQSEQEIPDVAAPPYALWNRNVRSQTSREELWRPHLSVSEQEIPPELVSPHALLSGNVRNHEASSSFNRPRPSSAGPSQASIASSPLTLNPRRSLFRTLLSAEHAPPARNPFTNPDPQQGPRGYTPRTTLPSTPATRRPRGAGFTEEQRVFIATLTRQGLTKENIHKRYNAQFPDATRELRIIKGEVTRFLNRTGRYSNIQVAPSVAGSGEQDERRARVVEASMRHRWVKYWSFRESGHVSELTTIVNRAFLRSLPSGSTSFTPINVDMLGRESPTSGREQPPAVGDAQGAMKEEVDMEDEVDMKQEESP